MCKQHPCRSTVPTGRGVVRLVLEVDGSF